MNTPLKMIFLGAGILILLLNSGCVKDPISSDNNAQNGSNASPQPSSQNDNSGITECIDANNNCPEGTECAPGVTPCCDVFAGRC